MLILGCQYANQEEDIFCCVFKKNNRVTFGNLDTKQKKHCFSILVFKSYFRQ